VSFLASQPELDLADAERQRKVNYYVGIPSKNMRGHLYDFCVDVLGYDALSPTFHKPMLDDWDRMDLKRFRIYEGIEERGKDPIDNLDLWFRGAIKTWCTRARVLRYYVWNPATTVTWWHAVEDSAIESGEAIGAQLQQNKELRELFAPGILPAPNRKNWIAAGRFNLKGKRIGDSASMTCLGAGGEGTGKHSLVGVLDDFVGWNDVVDGQMGKKKQFYQATVCNVVMRLEGKHGWKDAIGTHWAIDDPYVEWRTSSDWVSRVRACLETDGVPDAAGSPVYLSKDQIEKERREQGSTMFAFQMMNDPSASGEKPWVASECEHTCTLEEAKGPGWVVVFGDPAPRAFGSTDGRDERVRRDGSKNYWAIIVAKLKRKGDLRQIILLDGKQSKFWGLEEGMKEQVKLALKWRATEGYTESTSTPVFLQAFMDAKKDLGWKGYVIGSRKDIDSNDKLKMTYNNRAKIQYLQAFSDRAKEKEVVVCESFPPELREILFSQMRGFMPQPDGRTGIPFDDLANAASFATDPYFKNRYPAVDEEWSWSPYKTEQRDEATNGSRYVQW
jgi:hypothetical protein